MKEKARTRFHKLYGVRKARMAYHNTDFIDYVLMNGITAVVVWLSYGPDNPLTAVGIALCVALACMFPQRHGTAFRIPVIVRRPQDALYMLLYKIENLKPVFFAAVGVLLLENYLIHLTPAWPHHVQLLRTLGLYLFYAHFLGILAYRTGILIAYLAKREHVREVLLQTTWRNVLARQPSITLHIVHAYLTGVLSHLVLIAPWYIVIRVFNFSVIFLPVVLVLNAITQWKFFRTFNAWFYRDHWLGHNTEFEFIYLHGSHHDGLPCGLIGVAGNGHLEGFLRHTCGYVTAFLNPLAASIVYTFDIKRDIDLHQYIPGVFPIMSRRLHEVTQHSMHHMGRLEPYGIGLKFDQPQVSPELRNSIRLPAEITDSIRLDEQLTDFKWDSPRYKAYLELVDKYQPTEPGGQGS
jgi:hypothetical protein